MKEYLTFIFQAIGMVFGVGLIISGIIGIIFGICWGLMSIAAAIAVALGFTSTGLVWFIITVIEVFVTAGVVYGTIDYFEAKK